MEGREGVSRAQRCAPGRFASRSSLWPLEQELLMVESAQPGGWLGLSSELSLVPAWCHCKQAVTLCSLLLSGGES